MVDTALETRIIELRRKIIQEGYNPSEEEVKESLDYLRQKRGTAAAKKAEKDVAPIDLASLFANVPGALPVEQPKDVNATPPVDPNSMFKS